MLGERGVEASRERGVFGVDYELRQCIRFQPALEDALSEDHESDGEELAGGYVLDLNRPSQSMLYHSRNKLWW